MKNISRVFKLLKDNNNNSPLLETYIKKIEEFIQIKSIARLNDSLDDKDKQIIKFIINPPSEFKTSGYSNDGLSIITGIRVSNMLMHFNWKLEDVKNSILKLIALEYLEPLAPISIEVADLFEEVRNSKPDIKPEEYGMIVEYAFKCKHILDNFETLDLTVSGNGYKVYFKMIFGEVDNLEQKVIEASNVINDFKVNTKRNIDEYNTKFKESEDKVQSINNKLREAIDKIEKFDINIISILTLLITAFSIIGVNLNTIPNIKENFIINIITINMSVMFAILTLFWLINIIVYDNRYKIIQYAVLISFISLIGIFITTVFFI